MRKKARILGILLFIMIGIMFYRIYKKSEGIRFVKNMGSGINVGNTLDVTGIAKRVKDADIEYYETYWHNPLITKTLFEMIKKEGFGTVRIPVSWEEHMDESYQVDEEWMDRVEEVVDEALDQGLYVILDTHHESWLVPSLEKEKNTEIILRTLWEQIAVRFTDYPEQLLFEGMNEPRVRDSEKEWQGGTKEEREVVNRLNDAFVETVRNTGAGNTKRWLILTPYGNNYNKSAMKDLKLPNDSKVIVAVHAYIPYDFTLNESGTSSWELENEKDTVKISKLMSDLNELFIKKGVPVIITEFGCIDKDNLVERLQWTDYYTGEAKKNGVAYIWWDEGGIFALMDRTNYKWKFVDIVRILVR